MEETEAIQAEKLELDLLIDKGVEFKVVESVTKRGKGLKWFRKHTEEVEQTFKVKQPTLGVLDRLSAEFIKLKVDEEGLVENPLQESKLLVAKHSRTIARIVAIAVLREECRDEGKVTRLADLFYRTVTPSQMLQLTNIIHLAANYASFTASIRSMSSARTTRPKETERIDKKG